MRLCNARILFLWLLLKYACSVTTEAKTTTSRIGKNATNASLSPWLKTVLKNKDKDKDPRDKDPRAVECRGRPWICNQGSLPFRMRCCRNRCVDITSDVNHCGACLVRCPFTWQCCFGLCRNININPIHCGRCFNRCPFGVPCLFGLCGHARPLLPRRPDPFKPRPPKALPAAPHPAPGIARPRAMSRLRLLEV